LSISVIFRQDTRGTEKIVPASSQNEAPNGGERVRTADQKAAVFFVVKHAGK
jgi:hypothetical protein